MRAMPKLTRRAGALGMALTVYDLWRKLPPAQRRQLMGLARRHGPTVASRIAQARRRPKL
jgi:hypothetical protein